MNQARGASNALRNGCIVLVALFVLGVCVASSYQSHQTESTGASAARSQSPSPLPTPKPFGCVQPNATGSHVYNPDRLQVLQPCITVTGTIDFIRQEQDGDDHIGLKLDPQFADLVNSCNSTCLGGAEHGDLVVEPVCVTAPTQADAVSSCVGYHNPIVIPPVGTHVSVTGAYVLDVDHGWTEIHPLVEIHAV